ncbi:MAG: helix-turn-helix transcriptional regulator [Nostocaceae cyanobacterium]|nr:helix-turn-helix transcriptional regulator [Nostocaceae cyanobacterium]
MKQALLTYDISQTELATALGVRRSVVNHWITERRIPSADRVLDIRDALQSIDPRAAEEFIRLYLDS